MQMFRAYFYKDLLNSEGKVFRCLERQCDLSAAVRKSGAKSLSEIADALNERGIRRYQVESGNDHLSEIFSPKRNPSNYEVFYRRE